jgi:hypothetical protein
MAPRKRGGGQQVTAFAQALGNRGEGRSDRCHPSARGGTKLAAAIRPTIQPVADAETTALGDRIAPLPEAGRLEIIQMITAGGQRKRRASARLQKSIQRLRETLQKELVEIDRDILDFSGTMRSVARRCAATTKVSWSRCPASARRSRAR